MFTPREVYERAHRKPRQSLSIAQIAARQSVDAETVALIWLMLERGASLTVAGPTEPKPGAGKTTSLHALLQFLPQDATVAYMTGMYETFAFTRLPGVDPATTYALCNEISDHIPTYMWGRVARRFLRLPAAGYHVITSVHADTFEDVLHLYRHELCLRCEDIRRLGITVNIGLIAQGKAELRRWLNTYFLWPEPHPIYPEAILPLQLSRWKQSDDSFEHADEAVLAQLADWANLPIGEFHLSLQQRTDCLKELARGKGADTEGVREAVQQFREQHEPAGGG